MKSIFIIQTFLIVSLLISGCELNTSSSKKVAKVVNLEEKLTVKKYMKIKSGEVFRILFDRDIKYIQKINALDSELFSVNSPEVKLNFIPNIDEPKDINRDNIYELKLYSVDKSNNDFITLLQIEVISSNDDNNSSNSGSNENSSSDNNSSSSEDNSSTNTDNNSTSNENNSTDDTNSDMDNDYIPDNIERLLGYDTNSSDQNNNGVIDGLEGDKFFAKQWYIRANGKATNPSEIPSIIGNDLNLLDVYKKYMGYNKGEPIILQIVDSGVDIEHEDLKDNIDLARSLNNDKVGNPIPGGFYRPHGTMLAGIAAASAFNNKGIRGVAPFAKIAASNWLVEQSLDGLDAAWSSGAGANKIAVTNNSWGRYYTIDTFYEDIMEEGAKKLRDGKGRIYVFASGNARSFNADSNIQYVINNQYAIVVSALEIENRVASYSTSGANVWISAYGGANSFNIGPTIATTYISGESVNTWQDDDNKSYTYAMAGSSAAAPMVTAAIGLILEACPNLGWRDVKYILAKSAKKVDEQNSNWVTNSAGFNFNRDYGFGLIDTKKAIDICKNGYTNLGAQYIITATTKYTNYDINGSKELSINVNKDKKVEWVEATIDLDTQNASDYKIYLTSPSGTKTLLIQDGTKIGESFIPNEDWMRGGFRFGASAFLDEPSAGEWRVEIIDTKTNIATIKNIELKIYAH